MSFSLLWQSEGNTPDNASNFSTICQWWQSLASQDLLWQQRLIPETQNIKDINWDNQQFDEKLAFESPQVRGITLYWQKPNASDERSITPRKLEFDRSGQFLNIYPQSQPQLMIRITKLPLYQRIELKNPLIVGTAVGNEHILLLRDKQQKLEVKLSLNSESLNQLLTYLTNNSEKTDVNA